LVTIRPQVYADAGVDKNAVACSGSCVVLGGSLPAFGGIGGPYTYNWTPGTNLNDSTIGNPTACGLLNTRTYSLIVTDGSGCASQADYVTVFVTPSGMQAEAGNGGNICRESGDSIQLGGFPTVVGGTPAYTYNWAPTAGLFQTNIANPMAYPVISTRYYVTVTDANGCIAIDSTIVGAYPKLDINAGQASTVCQGTNFQLGGNPTAHGGSGSGYTYIWSPVTGITNATIANPIANASVNTTYQLTVTDGNGCSATDNVVLTVNPSPNAFAGPDKEITNCKDDSVRLGDSPSGSGGTPPLAYLWQPGTGLNDSTISNPTASGLTADQQYVLLVTDANGCIQTDYVDVTVLDRAPSIFVDLPTDSVCPNSPVTVTATYSSNTTNIQWSTVGGPVIANGLAPVTVYPGTGGNYCLVATAQTSLAVCNARDTACIFVLDKCVTVHIDTIYDTIPVNTNDTICVGGYVISSGGGAWTIVTLCDPADGTATTINGDTCFVFSPTSGYTGDAPFCIVVCDAYGCDTGLVIITIIDTNQCHFPNTITPNDDGQNEQFEVSCNDYFPKSEIRIFDRWGAEVYRSTGHYANDWSAKNLQGTKVPDGTYYYLYYFNDGSGRMHKGFVDVYR
jgi:gliding motility-associated-like protein